MSNVLGYFYMLSIYLSLSKLKQQLQINQLSFMEKANIIKADKNIAYLLENIFDKYRIDLTNYNFVINIEKSQSKQCREHTDQSNAINIINFYIKYYLNKLKQQQACQFDGLIPFAQEILVNY
ncbi:hypothetical protein TTHERM_00849420 (macronuclear) [Tetrahymena thermophila SB210]|uniref:Uncharacterized protein n=1 Tax=Tetrahymena thermophila (strain SB210) TaxID=312017 RepID=Q23R42_TETTS|nr:hypothetical protein TTHERM_00849420 [Tetrahymena thermophila SB210]EAR98999.1 hypothetical protein TTHERM_00849420 [Tetrahymena thermophila SB210]|eukprot:XP_001019244.1 hypothetical protein TTHERM_00849420 [Tetrahymena thermophila SB210]